MILRFILEGRAIPLSQEIFSGYSRVIPTLEADD